MTGLDGEIWLPAGSTIFGIDTDVLTFVATAVIAFMLVLVWHAINDLHSGDDD